MKLQLLFLFLVFSTSSFGQFKFKVSLDNDSIYTVYLKSDVDVLQPTIQSGQITITAPLGSMEVTDIQSQNGQWKDSPIGIISGPIENENTDYIVIGLIDWDAQGTGFSIKKEEEIALITFKNAKSCEEGVETIAVDDPFIRFPNSVNNNPANDLSIFDASNGKIHNVDGRYDVGSTSCLSTSVKETLNLSFTIYPNPIQDQPLFVERPNFFDLTTLSLRNLNGTLIFEKRWNTDKIMLDLQEIPAGIYIITAHDINSGSRISKKIVKL